MAKKKKIIEDIKPVQEAAIVVVPQVSKGVVLEGDPDAQLAYAAKAANALMGLMKQKKSPVIIQGKQYLEFGDWQVIARFYGASVEIEWTKPIVDNAGKLMGYEARALVRRNGETVASAEGMCMRDEKRWKTADEYAVRSMAQTRTSAKALRNAFGWVAELAGYSATPAEEMPRDVEPMKPYRMNPSSDLQESQKETIKNLLVALEAPCNTLAQAQKSVMELVRMELVSENYAAIIVALTAKMDETDPLAQHLKTIE